MPTNARRRRPLDTGGPWGTGLLLLGVATTVQGIAYLIGDPSDLGPALRWVGEGIPVRCWSVLWILAGLYSMLRALTPPQRHTDVAPVVAVITLWSAIYFIHWIYSAIWLGHLTRDWTAGLAWASLGALIMSWSRCVNPPTGRR